MKLKYLTTASLINVLADKVIDLRSHPKQRKRLQEIERKRSNEKVLRELRRQKEFVEDDKVTLDQRKVWDKVPKKFRELGMIKFQDPDFEVESVGMDYLDELNTSGIKDKKEAEKLAEEYIEEHKGLNVDLSFFMTIFEEEDIPSLGPELYFLIYPESSFGVENVGPSINLLNPSEDDLYKSIDQALKDNFEFIVIYSDNDTFYKQLFSKIKQEQEDAI